MVFAVHKLFYTDGFNYPIKTTSTSSFEIIRLKKTPLGDTSLCKCITTYSEPIFKLSTMSLEVMRLGLRQFVYVPKSCYLLVCHLALRP